MAFTTEEILAELSQQPGCSSLVGRDNTGRRVPAHVEDDLQEPQAGQLPARNVQPRRVDRIIGR